MIWIHEEKFIKVDKEKVVNLQVRLVVHQRVLLGPNIWFLTGTLCIIFEKKVFVYKTV